jgi:lactate dehydrogenase-like 2-hydroxyacid dehydrogenase
MVAPKQVERAALEKALESGSLARIGYAVDVFL